MLEVQEFWTIIATVITFAVTIIGIVIGFYKHLDNKIESKYKDIDGKLKELRQEIVHDLKKDMEGLAIVFHKLLKVLKDKDMLTPGDVFNVFGSEYIQRYSGKFSNPDPYREKRKAELLRKAQERTITYSEAMELKKLLEEQKRKHESSGDIVGAILAYILLMALLWLISEIFGKKEH